MSGLSPKEVVSASPWSSPRFQPVDGEPLLTEMPGCLIPPWIRRTCITVAVSRSKHGTCLSTYLSRGTCLTVKPLQKLVAGFFSCSCDTQYQNTLPSQFFMIEHSLSLRKVLLFSMFFQQAAEENVCSFNPGVYLVRGQIAESLQALETLPPKHRITES